MNSVQEFYKDKTIFITGGSGFLEKVLIEKLLYSCSDLKQIILLVRPKRWKSEEDCIENFRKLSLFKRIIDEKQEMFDKIKIIWGDIMQPNLAMTKNTLSHVISCTNIVFHLAASTKLEESLKPNIMINLNGTRNVINMAKQMRNLSMMVHVSTPFCNIEFNKLDEKVYYFPHRPLDLIQCSEWMNAESMKKIQNAFLIHHSSPFMYTKRMTEILINDEFHQSSFPVCIVRPGIITPTFCEPFAGWMDSIDGPLTTLIGNEKGSCLMLDKNVNFEAIPVDFVVDGLILVAMTDHSQRPKEIPVYNMTMHETKKISYGKFFNIIDSVRNKYSTLLPLWFLSTKFTTNKFIFWMYWLIFSCIPAYFIDFISYILDGNQSLVKAQKHFLKTANAITSFTMHKRTIESNNFQNLASCLSEHENEIFCIDSKSFNIEEYLKKSLMCNMLTTNSHPTKAQENLSLTKNSKTKLRVLIESAVNRFKNAWATKKKEESNILKPSSQSI